MLELIGLVLPFLIDIINKHITNSKVKFLISLFVSLALAAWIKFDALVGGDVLSVLQSAGIVFAEAQTVYKLYWEKSAVRTALLK